MFSKLPKRLVLAAVVLLLLVGAAVYKLYQPQTQGLTATGTIEVTKADITPKVSGYIRGLKFDVGTKLQAGQPVLTIERKDLQAQLLRDEAALAKAKTQLTELENGSRSQEILEAEAAVESAAAVAANAQKDYNRYAALYEQNAISTQQLDTARLSREVADRSLKTAQAKLSLAREGTRAETIQAQRQEVEQAQAVLDASRSQVADTLISCPADGLILSKNFEEGEFVTAGAPIATLGEMQDCWVKVYVASGSLGRIQVGQEVEVRIDAFPERKFVGKIKEISQNAEYTPRQSITKQERANMVFAVKVKLDNEEGIFKPGMPADVVIL